MVRHELAQLTAGHSLNTSRRSALWAAGLTTSEAAALVDYSATSNSSNRRLAPPAAQVALRLSPQQKRERQVRQIGKMLRGMVAARRSASGKQMAGTIVSAFEALDGDGSGKLSHDEFARALTRLGMGLTPKQLDVLLGCLDVDGDGKVSLPEFLSFLTEPPEEQPSATSRRRRRRNAPRKSKQAGTAADVATAEALRLAAAEVLLGHAAIEACNKRWEPSSALRAIDVADLGAGAALTAVACLNRPG